MNDRLPTPADRTPPDQTPAAVENRFHSYVGNRIPWYVRLIWLLFWVFAVSYVILYLFPALRVEITNPP
jgi:hypothetical protein